MTPNLSMSVETCFTLEDEREFDFAAREDLLDRAMGAGRKRKSSEKLRRGRLPSAGLAFVARNGAGGITGSVRLWDVSAGGKPLLLLGPLAVDPSVAGQGIGSALMRHAIDRAAWLGHGAIILVGDAPYYTRFGFSAAKTAGLMMPGPVERDRLLGCELAAGYLDEAAGLLVAEGRRRSTLIASATTRLVKVACSGRMERLARSPSSTGSEPVLGDMSQEAGGGFSCVMVTLPCLHL